MLIVFAKLVPMTSPTLLLSFITLDSKPASSKASIRALSAMFSYLSPVYDLINAPVEISEYSLLYPLSSTIPLW